MALLRSVCLFLGTLSAFHSVACSPQRVRRQSPRLSLALASRQNDIPNVPPQCTSSCDPVDAILETGVSTIWAQSWDAAQSF
jgi:hypothetical protein